MAKIKICAASPATEVKRTQRAPNVQNGFVFHSKRIPGRDFGTLGRTDSITFSRSGVPIKLNLIYVNVGAAAGGYFFTGRHPSANLFSVSMVPLDRHHA